MAGRNEQLNLQEPDYTDFLDLDAPLIEPHLEPREKSMISLREAGWLIPLIEPAPMLAMSNAMKEKKKQTPDGQFADFSVGEPVLTKEIIKETQNLIMGELTLDRKRVYEKNGVVGELDAWARKMVEHMTHYSPKTGNEETRKYFLSLSPEGSFKENQLAVITGGFSLADEHIDNLLCQSMVSKSFTLATRVDGKKRKMLYEGAHLVAVDLQSKSFGAVMEEIDEVRRKGDYVKLVVRDSGKLSQEQREALAFRANDGHMFIIDLLTDGKITENSLGLHEKARDFVLSVNRSKEAELTGVTGIYGHTEAVKYIRERHTNLYGTPSASEMDFMVKLVEIANDNHKIEELLSLGEEKIDNLPIPKNGMLKTLIRLFQTGIRYIKKEDYGALESFHDLTRKQVAQLEDQTAVFHNDLIPQKHTVILNGGARGSLGDVFDYMADIHHAKRYIFTAPCWPYRDLKKRSDWEFIYAEDSFTLGGFNIKSLEPLLKNRRNRNAVLVLPMGPDNPSGKLIKEEDLERITQLAKENNIHIVTDPTYLYATQFEQGKKALSVSSSMKNSGVRPDDTVALTFSKNFIAPGLRIGAVMTDDRTAVDYFKNKRKLKEINPMAIALLTAMTGDKEGLARIMEMSRKEMDYRIKILQKEAKGRRRKYGDPDGGYYLLVESKAATVDSVAGPRKMAEQFGAAALSVETMMSGGPRSKGLVRIAAAGMYTHKEFEKAVKHFFDADDNVAAELMSQSS